MSDELTKRAAIDWRAERDARRNKQDEPPAGLSFDQIVEWVAKREAEKRKAAPDQGWRPNIAPLAAKAPDGNRHQRCTENGEADREIDALRARWPAEFRDGLLCALLRSFPGEREAGGYPRGFHQWPLDRRDAWFAGFNVGFHDRLRLKEAAK